MEVAIFLKINKRGGGETHLIILEGATYLLYCSYQTSFSGFQNFEYRFTISLHIKCIICLKIFGFVDV